MENLGLWDYIEYQVEKEQNREYQKLAKIQKNQNFLSKDKILIAQQEYNKDPGYKTLELKNFQNLQYYTEIRMGSHKQLMTLDLDTGSHQLWVPTIDCLDSEGIMQCHKENDWYDYQKSKNYRNYNKKAEIWYIKGACRGNLGEDELIINGIKVIQKDMIFVSSEDEIIRRSLKSDGILGLSNQKSINNFIDTAYKNGLLQDNKFTFQLNWHGQDSFFHFGKIPDNIINNSFFLKSQRNSYWTILVTDFQINGISVQKQISNNQAVIDSGTSYILTGQNLFNEIWKKLEETGHCVTNHSQSSFNCKCLEYIDQSEYPSIQIYTRGLKFELNAVDYINNQHTGEYCNLQIRPIPGNQSMMLFGDTFMRKYTVTYDKDNNEQLINGSDEQQEEEEREEKQISNNNGQYIPPNYIKIQENQNNIVSKYNINYNSEEKNVQDNNDDIYIQKNDKFQLYQNFLEENNKM